MMKTIVYDPSLRLTQPCVATIGFFDGVHRGHRFLLRQLKEEAQQRQQPAMVITFDRHPRQVLCSDYQPRMLGTLEEKIALLSQTGIDLCVVLPFTPELAALSARDFMQLVLYRQLAVHTLLTGYDNRFGHNRSEGFADYVAYGREMGMEVLAHSPFVMGGVKVSSSVIRSFLQEGEVRLAAQCLGYPYLLSGEVVSGCHVGTGMGFPTANIRPLADKLIPATGAYAVMVTAEGRQWQGMMNIGSRPTFDGRDTTLEVNLFDFDANLYGKTIGVSLVERLRDERKFRNAAELTNQLEHDADEARRILGSWQTSPATIIAPTNENNPPS